MITCRFKSRVQSSPEGGSPRVTRASNNRSVREAFPGRYGPGDQGQSVGELPATVYGLVDRSFICQEETA